MANQFRIHYTLEEARALLPHVRRWLKGLRRLRDELQAHHARLGPLLAQGADLGGAPTHRWLRTLADWRELVREFDRRNLQLKDLDRGLVDFPTERDGREVFLCWEESESDIEYWHELESGYAGREPL